MELYSDRLHIRQITEADADAIFAYRSLPEVAKYQYWEPYTREDAIAYVKKCAEPSYNRGEWVGLVIIEKASGKLIGDCAFCIDEHNAEMGCNVLPLHQGQGYAKEALPMLIDHIFAQGTKEIQGITDSENEASVRLMQSVGMQHDAGFSERVECKGSWCVEHRYVIYK